MFRSLPFSTEYIIIPTYVYDIDREDSNSGCGVRNYNLLPNVLRYDTYTHMYIHALHEFPSSFAFVSTLFLRDSKSMFGEKFIFIINFSHDRKRDILDT